MFPPGLKEGAVETPMELLLQVILRCLYDFRFQGGVIHFYIRHSCTMDIESQAGKGAKIHRLKKQSDIFGC